MHGKPGARSHDRPEGLFVLLHNSQSSWLIRPDAHHIRIAGHGNIELVTQFDGFGQGVLCSQLREPVCLLADRRGLQVGNQDHVRADLCGHALVLFHMDSARKGQGDFGGDPRPELVVGAAVRQGIEIEQAGLPIIVVTLRAAREADHPGGGLLDGGDLLGVVQQVLDHGFDRTSQDIWRKLPAGACGSQG